MTIKSKIGTIKQMRHNHRNDELWWDMMVFIKDARSNHVNTWRTQSQCWLPKPIQHCSLFGLIWTLLLCCNPFLIAPRKTNEEKRGSTSRNSSKTASDCHIVIRAAARHQQGDRGCLNGNWNRKTGVIILLEWLRNTDRIGLDENFEWNDQS